MRALNSHESLNKEAFLKEYTETALDLVDRMNRARGIYGAVFSHLNPGIPSNADRMHARQEWHVAYKEARDLGVELFRTIGGPEAYSHLEILKDANAENATGIYRESILDEPAFLSYILIESTKK